MSTKSSKKQPQRLSIPIRTRTREEDDSRVSSLPDSILCHILSFLPTKQAVATTILSKRWKPLCLSVSILDFDFNDISTLSMKTSANLFCLVYSVMLSRHDTLPIQTFRLICCPSRTRTLTVLKLKRLTIWEDIPQINNNISPLKTLHLEKLYFTTYTHLINFLLSFPLLEELETNDLHICQQRFVPKEADKIKCLRNLMTAKISDNEPLPLFLLSRVHANLSIKLTRACFVEVPVFYNLTQMEIFSDLKRRSWPNKWMWILEMLQNTPKLQHLIIHEEIENGNDHEEYSWEDPKKVPECLSSQLKTCLFRNYRANECELQFAEYVMRSSKVGDGIIG
ncbi:F-box/LRR-repeat protein [Trifolium pratense]|uniref:F-box/LRR-repeat protein n=1 Tax=Trifolium pratense TaxID=57577 RepID=A0A2K3NBY9_TRIPR|nr:F-box/LRR-repeat protein [Trifolium pratense]